MPEVRPLQGQAGDERGGGLTQDGGGTPRPPRVAVDALGGDHGPHVVVQGTVAACRRFGLRAALVGPREVVAAELAKAGGEGLDIEIADAPETIGMAPLPTARPRAAQGTPAPSVLRSRLTFTDQIVSGRCGSTKISW